MKRLLALLVVLLLAAPALAEPAAFQPEDFPEEFVLPVPAEGETVYLGEGSVSQAECFFVAFVRGADGGVSAVTFYAVRMDFVAVLPSAEAHIEEETYTEEAETVEVLSEEPLTVQAGPSELRGIVFTEDGAQATVAYAFTFTPHPIFGGETQYVPFDEALIDFVIVP